MSITAVCNFCYETGPCHLLDQYADDHVSLWVDDNDVHIGPDRPAAEDRRIPVCLKCIAAALDATPSG